jgi:lipopolysaccharide transport system permease protein
VTAARGESVAHWSGFAWTLVRTDFKTRYHGTIGGFLWALAKPIAMFLVLWSVFSLVFASSRSYKLDLLIGLLLWEFFAEGTRAGLSSLSAKGFLLARARFPSWLVVVTSVANATLTMAVFAVLIVAAVSLEAGRPAIGAAVLFALYVFQLAVLSVGMSLAMSVLFLRYRDLNQIWDVVIQAGFFIAPIIYPLEVLPERFHLALYAWPPTPIIEFSRDVLVDGRVPTATAHALLASVTAVTLFTGVLVFRHAAPRAAERL